MDQVDEVLGYRRPSGEIKENIKGKELYKGLVYYRPKREGRKKGGGGKSYSHKLVYIVCLPQ
jgi:hypothetical protein